MINLPVFMRVKGVSATMRGQAAGVEVHTENGKMQYVSFFINGLSSKAVSFLADAEVVEMDFVLMATKISAVAKVKELKSSSICVSIPEFLEPIERRSASRFNSNSENPAFIRLPNWHVEEDLTTMPVMGHFRNLLQFFSLRDISSVGACIESHFPSGYELLKRDYVEQTAHLHFPLAPPCPVSFEVKWVKVLRERDEATESAKVIFRYGIRFLQVTRKSELAIKAYIHQLSDVAAI